MPAGRQVEHQLERKPVGLDLPQLPLTAAFLRASNKKGLIRNGT
jgi:hypothetical protein